MEMGIAPLENPRSGCGMTSETFPSTEGAVRISSGYYLALRLPSAWRGKPIGICIPANITSIVTLLNGRVLQI